MLNPLRARGGSGTPRDAHLRTRRDRDLGAQRCGYRDNNHLKNLFKRTFSMSMRDYRCA